MCVCCYCPSFNVSCSHCIRYIYHYHSVSLSFYMSVFVTLQLIGRPLMFMSLFLFSYRFPVHVRLWSRVLFVLRHSLIINLVAVAVARLRMQMLNLCYVYYLSKLTEFADTIFFVLKKKKSQLTWLHLYHHSLTPLEAWILVKFLSGKPAL